MRNCLSCRPGWCEQNSQKVWDQRSIQANGSLFILAQVIAAPSSLPCLLPPLLRTSFFLCLLSCWLLALRSRHQHHRFGGYGRRGSHMFLLANTLSPLAFLFCNLLSTAVTPWRPSKETSPSGLISAPFLVKGIVSGCIRTIVFHSHWWFHHLWFWLIPIAFVGLDLKLFPIPVVTTAGKGAVLLMDFVRSKFDSPLLTKASRLLKLYQLYI